MFLEWENNNGKLRTIRRKFQNKAINDVQQILLSHVIMEINWISVDSVKPLLWVEILKAKFYIFERVLSSDQFTYISQITPKWNQNLMFWCLNLMSSTVESQISDSYVLLLEKIKKQIFLIIGKIFLEFRKEIYSGGFSPRWK